VQRKYQIATDMTDLVGETFLASTIGCARCHNHKADRVSQKEYFQLQAFFANTSFDEKAPAAKGEQEIAFEKQQAIYREATKDIRAKQKAILDTVRDRRRQVPQGTLPDRQPRSDLQAGERVDGDGPLGQLPPEDRQHRAGRGAVPAPDGRRQGQPGLQCRRMSRSGSNTRS
jgi:hypothetical protein